MKVQELMKSEVWTVASGATLHDALHQMWSHDIGALPVVDADRRIVGMITDRDAAMATYLKGRKPADIAVLETMSPDVAACRPDDGLSTAEDLMRTRQIRRLPVTDATGHVVGMITLADLAIQATDGVRKVAASGLVKALGAIAQPRTEGE